MFASSQYPTAGTPRGRSVLGASPQDGEGRDSEAARTSTVELLLPHGRPGRWLLLLAASCMYVAVRVIALHLA